jgi:hypothetical protein
MNTTEKPLTTGWEADTPVEDSLLRRYLFHWAGYCEAYAQAARGATLRRDTFHAADLRRASGYFNSATLLCPPGADFTAVLDEVERFFAPGHGEVLLWSAWPTPDLTARGWRLEGHPPLLMRPPAAVLEPPAAPPVDVRRVRDPAGLAEWERVVIDGYPLPELADLPTPAIADPALLQDPRVAFWTGYEDDRAVSVGTSFVSHGIGSFALGVTLPEARRRHHWLRHAVERLRHSPDVWMTGVFSDFSRPGAERIGFVPILRFTLWSRPRPTRKEKS